MSSGELNRLAGRVADGYHSGTPFEILGGGTKRFYGNEPCGEPLAMEGLSGISAYEPAELFITALAGTRVTELEEVLAASGQNLAFEPPRFGPAGTVGGMVAAGLAGPARSSAGPLRDFLLGATIVNGTGQVLTFGGQVIKNVAGYDLSRIFAGSMGILGLICEVSLKVVPASAASRTLSFDLDQEAALRQLNRWAGKSLPLSASAWYEGRLVVRLSGASAAVDGAHRQLGGIAQEEHEAEIWWSDLRDQRHEFFTLDDAQLSRGEILWRLSVPDTAPRLLMTGRQMIEWGGAQRWLRTDAPAPAVRAAAATMGGHATLIRAADKSAGAFAGVAPGLMEVHRRLKRSFDPGRIFNPGRLYAEL
ncbi:MAG: glycolate oxidase subunit GlcE [Steroidobacteraceae bacterium]